MRQNGSTAQYAINLFGGEVLKVQLKYKLKIKYK